MIINTYLHIKETWPLDQYPYKTDVKKKAADVLGISAPTLFAVLKEYKSMDEGKPGLLHRDKHQFKQKLENLEKCAIRKKIHNFYVKGELPTFTNVLQAVNDDASISNFSQSTFRRLLRYLQIKYVKRHMTHALIDTDSIVLSRRSYLKKIKEYRQQDRKIFYIGVACISSGQTYKSKGREMLKELVVMHIGNEKGFLEGGEKLYECKSLTFYHSLPTSYFEKWFEDVLPKLGENAVVVLDKAPYCSRLLEDIASLDWSKLDVQNWLESKDISFDPSETKVELLEKVKKVKNDVKKYMVDELAKKFKVEILWLPPQHYDLSPIEYILADVQGCADFDKSNLKIEDIADIVLREFQKVTAETWRQKVNLVISEEDNYYSKIDEIIDRTVDTFFTGVVESDTDSVNSLDDSE